ncbi:MAG: penicillin-binding protein 2 [Mycobacteriales bacterium]|nr:penicillin-binding protein 2 [Mycobacteriales bacterium]
MSDRSRLRLFVLQVLVVSILATLLGRLWYIQVYRGESFAQAANSNRVREVITPAPRGVVVDARGRTLVDNRTALVVSVNRSLMRLEKDDGEAVLARLATVVGIPAAELTKKIAPCGKGDRPPTCWNGSPYQPVPVKAYGTDKRAELERVLMVLEHREDFRGVTAEFQAVREYPGGTSGAHLLGYLGPISDDERTQPGYAKAVSTAEVGRTGVEQVYDAALRGVDGVQQLLVDKDGNVTGEQTEGSTEPTAGDQLVLSIDRDVQKVSEDALRKWVEFARTQDARCQPGTAPIKCGKLRADSGAVVVMEAKTGRLVAMASYPSFDPTQFVGGISTSEYAALTDEKNGIPLINRPVQGLFAPASTFKVISTAAAVESGFYSLGGTYDCPGSYAPLNNKRNFEGRGLGRIDLRTALVKSCDTIFYNFAFRQWQRDGGLKPVANPGDHMYKMAKAFGLGERTGVDLPSERRGRVPDRAYKRAFWEDTKDDYCAGMKRRKDGDPLKQLVTEQCLEGFVLRGGDTANFSIGQGDALVSPLQLATVYAAVANGGTLVTPSVARALLSADGTRVTPVVTTPRGKVPVSAQVLDFMRESLGGVTQPGGTASSAFAGFPVRVGGKTGTAEVANKQDTSWFASFAPVSDPELVVVGMVSQGGTGGSISGRMVADVYKGIYGADGRKAALPGGKLPAALPRVRPDGQIAGPGVKVPGPAPTVTAPYVKPQPVPKEQSAPEPSAEPVQALGGPPTATPASTAPRRTPRVSGRRLE